MVLDRRQQRHHPQSNRSLAGASPAHRRTWGKNDNRRSRFFHDKYDKHNKYSYDNKDREERLLFSAATAEGEQDTKSPPPLRGISLLQWTNITQSIECSQPQGIITNGTDHVWLSCRTYIAHGTLQRNPYDGAIVGVHLDQFNYHALDGPNRRIRHQINKNKNNHNNNRNQRNETTEQSYGHISDGDYVRLHSSSSPHHHHHADELWFGLENGQFPRQHKAAIARYNAQTLEFINLHEHPTLLTMPWLAFVEQPQLALTCNWTNGGQEFVALNATTLQWTNNVTLTNLPMEYDELYQGIPFVQGAAMDNNNNGNDDHSTLQSSQAKHHRRRRLGTIWYHWEHWTLACNTEIGTLLHTNTTTTTTTTTVLSSINWIQ